MSWERMLGLLWSIPYFASNVKVRIQMHGYQNGNEFGAGNCTKEAWLQIYVDHDVI